MNAQNAGKKIAARIDEVLKQQERSGAWLLRKARLGTNVLSAMRSGTTPRASTIELLASKLGVPAASLAPELIGEDPHTAAAVAHAGGQS